MIAVLPNSLKKQWLLPTEAVQFVYWHHSGRADPNTSTMVGQIQARQQVMDLCLLYLRDVHIKKCSVITGRGYTFHRKGLLNF